MVAELLDALCDSLGTPRSITCDNGPELKGRQLPAPIAAEVEFKATGNFTHVTLASFGL